jgi:hypothetical protein
MLKPLYSSNEVRTRHAFVPEESRLAKLRSCSKFDRAIAAERCFSIAIFMRASTLCWKDW